MKTSLNSAIIADSSLHSDFRLSKFLLYVLIPSKELRISTSAPWNIDRSLARKLIQSEQLNCKQSNLLFLEQKPNWWIVFSTFTTIVIEEFRLYPMLNYYLFSSFANILQTLYQPHFISFGCRFYTNLRLQICWNVFCLLAEKEVGFGWENPVFRFSALAFLRYVSKCWTFIIKMREGKEKDKAKIQ